MHTADHTVRICEMAFFHVVRVQRLVRGQPGSVAARLTASDNLVPVVRKLIFTGEWYYLMCPLYL